MARLALWAVLMIGVLAACDPLGQEPVPDSADSAPKEAAASVMFWAHGREVATGPWPESSFRGELDSPVTALAVVNDQLLAGAEDGAIRQLIPVQVADGGRLAPSRRVQPGCRIEAMAGRARQLWVLYRACDDQSLHVALIQLPDLKLTAQRPLAPDHGGPVAMAIGQEHLFVLISDPFELTRLRLSDLTPEGRIDLRQGLRPAYGFGQLLFVDESLWVIDRYRDGLIQVRPQGLGIDVSRSFASLDIPGAIVACDAHQQQVYCLAGGALHALDPVSMRARRLHTASAQLDSLLVYGDRLMFGNSDGTLLLQTLSGEIEALTEQALPAHIVFLH